jgi:phosphotriesterase-related protein
MIVTMANRREFLIQGSAAAALAVSKPHRVGVVQTVGGPVEASTLGFTLTHEHICACTPAFWETWPRAFDGRKGFVSRAVGLLKGLKDEGVGTLMDLSPYDVGRDIRLIEEISRKSGVRIVACTGQHLSPPPSLEGRTPDELAEFFIAEIERGIDGTDIRAGVIKIATALDVVTPTEERALRGAARASKITGIPIATHTHARLRGGDAQAAILEAEGVNPRRVSLGHSDDSGDFEYLVSLARRGYTLGMDHINRGLKPDARVSWQTRATHVRQLIDAGFADRIFLSQDSVLGNALLPLEAQGERETNNPDGMFFNTRKLIPHLKRLGVSDRQIHTMTVENPARFLSRA